MEYLQHEVYTKALRLLQFILICACLILHFVLSLFSPHKLILVDLFRNSNCLFDKMATNWITILMHDMTSYLTTSYHPQMGELSTYLSSAIEIMQLVYFQYTNRPKYPTLESTPICAYIIFGDCIIIQRWCSTQFECLSLTIKVEQDMLIILQANG